MVKVTGAPIASPTVLGLLLNVALAPLAEALILVSLKLLTSRLAKSLLENNWITWVQS